MLLTPLEQFQIISIFSVKVFCLDFSITNMLFINMLVLGLFSFLVYCFSSSNNDETSSPFFFYS